jgi:hypothetical protein
MGIERVLAIGTSVAFGLVLSALAAAVGGIAFGLIWPGTPFLFIGVILFGGTGLILSIRKSLGVFENWFKRVPAISSNPLASGVAFGLVATCSIVCMMVASLILIGGESPLGMNFLPAMGVGFALFFSAGWMLGIALKKRKGSST